MITLLSIVVIVAGLIVWIGQFFAFFAPNISRKLGLTEAEDEIDQTLYIVETKANALMDVLLSWTLPVAGTLMLMQHPYWPLFALFGGGVFIYFSGLLMLSRFFLKKHNRQVGSPSGVTLAYILGVVWMVSSIAMVVLAIMEIQ